MEPIRRVLSQKGRYYEAACTSIDPAARTLTCSYPEHTGLEAASSEFTLPYDILILGEACGNWTRACHEELCACADNVQVQVSGQ